MPKAATKHTTGALAELRAIASTPHPDAALLHALERLALLNEERDRLYKRHTRGFIAVVRAKQAERDALEAQIAATPARTAMGRRAKAETGLRMLGGIGMFADIARSALRDFLNAGAAP